jgi:hypothetical protein
MSLKRARGVQLTSMILVVRQWDMRDAKHSRWSQWETIYRPLPPRQSSPPFQFGTTGEYNAPFEERGGNFKMRKMKKAKRK